jgi:predicted transcriptional regulator
MNVCAYVNDDIGVNVWQDGSVTDPEPRARPDDQDPEPVRSIVDVATLRALADPLRLSILTVLMDPDREGALPIKSVKELATELDQPQTKLYRHVKQLEAVGLIQSVRSRVVSGIVEHRYQACQRDLILGPQLTESQKAMAATEAAATAAVDLYVKELFAARRAVRSAAPEADGPEQNGRLGINLARLSAEQAADVRQRLEQILEDLANAETKGSDDPDAVALNVLIGYFPSKSAAADLSGRIAESSPVCCG